MFNRFFSQMLTSHRTQRAIRAVLFVYLGLILCPIQYFALNGNEADNTWILGLNYAAAHHLVPGRDIVWPTGPLAYLAAPMDVGHNLVPALAFQAALWGMLLAILWDLFFRGNFALRNLAFFTIFIGLSGSLYHHPPNPLGAADLLLVGALILLVHFQIRGGVIRYVTAMLMLGLIPLFKFVGVMLAAGVVVGLASDQLIYKGQHARREIALACLLPAAVTGAGFWFALHSFHTLVLYVRGSRELSRGYSLAMSLWGRWIEFPAEAEGLILLVIALGVLAARDRRRATFISLLLAVPLLVNIKHALVRQDVHIVYALCFVAVGIGLIALATALDGQRSVLVLTAVALVFATLWQDYVAAKRLSVAIPAITGVDVPMRIWHIIPFSHLKRKLYEDAQRNLSSDELRVEPEIKAIIQREPVASLSVSYSGAYEDGLNLVLYPVVQRYSAYTPYLDQLNADWIREKGPRFLIFNPSLNFFADRQVSTLSIDGRDPWTETPAMWLEVYRWYNTRMLGTHTLLLERRPNPRFDNLESVSHMRLRFGDELLIPASPQPIFWTMKCSLTTTGKLRATLFRVLDVTMTINEGQGRGVFRVLPEVLGSPSLGNYLPSDLSEFAEVFSTTIRRYSFSVKKLSFGGPGNSAYAPVCEVEFLRPVDLQP